MLIAKITRKLIIIFFIDSVSFLKDNRSFYSINNELSKYPITFKINYINIKLKIILIYNLFPLIYLFYRVKYP